MSQHPSAMHGPKLTAELITAMVTPFKADGALDLDAAAKMAVYLADNGSDGILVNGTTGEAPTMTPEEKQALLRCVKQAVLGRPVQIMTGVGSNDTAKSMLEAQTMAAIGVDALLVVMPYYSKPSQRGLIAHFQAIANAVPETEIVIYNIPGRAAVLMLPETMKTLNALCPNIIGVKQSHPDMDQVSEISLLLPSANWRTWCGDDSLTLPMLGCGAHGIISVVAHLTGPLMRAMIQAFKAGNAPKALQLHLKQLTLARDLFSLPNPTVVKACLHAQGLLQPVMRPPMLWPDAKEQALIDFIVEQHQKIMTEWQTQPARA